GAVPVARPSAPGPHPRPRARRPPAGPGVLRAGRRRDGRSRGRLGGGRRRAQREGEPDQEYEDDDPREEHPTPRAEKAPRPGGTPAARLRPEERWICARLDHAAPARICPSRISIRRSAIAATSGSWVTMSTVRPSAWMLCNN